MSTVLTKPVLLDETGQAIVGKLEDIQQAIGGTGEFVPINIRVTTPPTKTNYLAGEALDLSGMVVTLVANNGGMYDVTGDCVFSPADGSVVTGSTTEVNISYTWYKDSTVFTAKQPLSIKELASIAVTTPPTVTEYTVGDTLDLTGIVVTATFADGTTSVVTNDCVFSPDDGATLAISDTTINISLTMGTVTKTTTQEISVIAYIYGVEWDGTATTKLTRTDLAADFVDPDPYYNGRSGAASSPFDNILPWSGMVKEERTGGTCVKIPKFWYKLTQSGTSLKIQIALSPMEGYSVSPAHMDRGDGNGERDYVYVGRYHCASDYKSKTGVTPNTGSRRFIFRNNIHALGNTIWQMDFAMRFTIWLLYIVEFADWDSQKVIGYGCGDNNSSARSMGYTDNMPYHTGTTKNSRTTYGLGTQYRYIEGLWDNVYDFVDGCRNHRNGLFVIKNPSDFSDNKNGVNVGTLVNGYIKGLSVSDADGAFPMFLSSDGNGSSTTYIPDFISNLDSSYIILEAGGYTGQSFSSGMFCLQCTSDDTRSATSGRLMELPANA